MEMPRKKGEEIISIELDEKDVKQEKSRKNLDFLRRALYDNDIDQNALAKKLKIDVETIDYWFRHDKCYISYFFSIAKYTGMKLKIDIKPKK
jgi:transcriptional regulator with PAS, ATPase and Fis domain